mgnify:CR=1 FL=1
MMKKLRFFFRRQLTLADFSPAQQDFIKSICGHIDPLTIRFKRTFNNVIYGKNFEFIGMYPVFFSAEIGYCYFSKSNEID